mmetsp:Transcript_115501/g.236183  ORF Transcript_115501/g.236183 Transcript_115501/m.236183 type:complete len:214 (-) Transcript_115501:188-829(-)
MMPPVGPALESTEEMEGLPAADPSGPVRRLKTCGIASFSTRGVRGVMPPLGPPPERRSAGGVCPIGPPSRLLLRPPLRTPPRGAARCASCRGELPWRRVGDCTSSVAPPAANRCGSRRDCGLAPGECGPLDTAEAFRLARTFASCSRAVISSFLLLRAVNRRLVRPSTAGRSRRPRRPLSSRLAMSISCELRTPMRRNVSSRLSSKTSPSSTS